MVLEYVETWDGPVSDGNRHWSDLDDFDESWMFECDTKPTELICMEAVLPRWSAESLIDTLKDNLDDNNSNEYGQYWSEFLCEDKERELLPKFQALIDEFILASSWRTWKETNKRIKTGTGDE
ncbi:MAG: hypothetical protein K2X77_18445 [Candidatus Obscuribacterales bacterium]|jgi:hypothetical protein|nr:hypothetical protein [Candidatus Obscuribacterales bacterium]